MKCSKCGKSLKDGDRFCIHCGAVVEAAPAAEEAAAKAEDCPGCGEELIPGDRFCQKCGASVGAVIGEKKTTRLSSPIETKYEALEGPQDAVVPEVIPPVAAARPIASRQSQGGQRSNRTFYQLLGLAFVLIACSYLAYDYFVTPRHTGTVAVTESEVAGSVQEAPTENPAEAGETLPAGAPAETPRPQAPISQVPVANKLAADVRTAQSAKRPPRESVHPVPESNQAAAPVRPPAERPPVAPVAAPVVAPAPSPSPTTTVTPVAPAPVAAASSPQPLARQPEGQPGQVLLPGSQARKPTPKAAPPQAAAPAPAPNRPAAITTPAPPPAPLNEGIIYWTGKLEKNKVVVIENGQVNLGQISGAFFTGIPVDVHLPSPAVALVERPTPQNNWKRVAFRCLRNTSGSVTINIQWSLLR